jgi:hypothetical protein
VRHRVFLCHANNGYEVARGVIDPDPEEMFDGRSVVELWRPLRVEIVRVEDPDEDDPRWFRRRRRLRRSDFPGLIQNPGWGLGERALAVLGERLLPCGEILPLDCEERALYAFNCTRFVDALDESQSLVDRFDDGRIHNIRHFVAHENSLLGIPIFRIPQLNRVYVTEDLVAAVQSAGLVGLKFFEL